MHYVDLVFGGITALAMSADRQRRRMVILDEREGHKSKASGGSADILPHYAYLRFALSDLKTDPDDFKDLDPIFFNWKDPIPPHNVTPSVVILLDHMELKVTTPVKKTFSINEILPQDPLSPQGEEKGSLYYVADMRKVYPGTENIDDRFVGPNPPLAAFIDLRWGLLRVKDLAQDATHRFEPQTLIFVDGQPRGVMPVYERYLAQRVGLKMDLEDDEEQYVTLQLSWIRRSPNDVPYEIEFHAANNPTLYIGNAPMDVILSKNQPHVCRGEYDYDFELYYDLCKNPPSDIFPVPRCLVRPAREHGSGDCPVGRFTIG